MLIHKLGVFLVASLCKYAVTGLFALLRLHGEERL